MIVPLLGIIIPFINFNNVDLPECIEESIVDTESFHDCGELECGEGSIELWGHCGEHITEYGNGCIYETGCYSIEETTVIDFTFLNGQSGKYSEQLNIFRKEGNPSPACSTIIQKKKVAGRGTHFCPKCQKKQY